MHELSIVEGIMRQVDEQRKKHLFSKVKAIEIACGKHSCASEDTLRFLFEAATSSTCMDGASLLVTRLAGRLRCSACGLEFEEKGEGPARCPSCASMDIAPVVDNSVYIVKLEVD